MSPVAPKGLLEVSLVLVTPRTLFAQSYFALNEYKFRRHDTLRNLRNLDVRFKNVFKGCK